MFTDAIAFELENFKGVWRCENYIEKEQKKS